MQLLQGGNDAGAAGEGWQAQGGKHRAGRQTAALLTAQLARQTCVPRQLPAGSMPLSSEAYGLACRRLLLLPPPPSRQLPPPPPTVAVAAAAVVAERRPRTLRERPVLNFGTIDASVKVSDSSSTPTTSLPSCSAAGTLSLSSVSATPAKPSMAMRPLRRCAAAVAVCVAVCVRGRGFVR